MMNRKRSWPGTVALAVVGAALLFLLPAPAAATSCGPDLHGAWTDLKSDEQWLFAADGGFILASPTGATAVDGPVAYACKQGKSKLVDLSWPDGSHCAFAIRQLNATTIELVGSCGAHFLQRG